MKAILFAVIAAALAVPCSAARTHRSFRGGFPVTPSTSPNARNYGGNYSNNGTGLIQRRDATPAFDFFTSGRFTLGGVHINDMRRDVISSAPKSGVANIQERVLEEKDGQPLVKEMVLLGSPTKGILVGRVGPQGGAQTEYRVGQLSVLLRNDRVEQVQAVFTGGEEVLRKFRDWAKPVFDKKYGVNQANKDVIPKGGFNGEQDLPRTNTWKGGGYVYELKYEPTPSRLIISAHR